MIEKKVEQVITPFQTFIKDQTTSSALLIVCTLIALAIANSPWANEYEKLLHLSLGFVLADYTMTMSLRHWVNDGLMTFFFFLLGMEIKRELLVGEINNVQRLMPILAAALGGMLFPAAIFYFFNYGTEYAHGWGIPMATDTAFAVGVLALLGRRVPFAAIAFLTALAIIDDLGAILVIALFYSESISAQYLALSALALLLLVLCNILGVRKSAVYLIGGLLVWAAMLSSGVHATVAGVLIAATVPARAKRSPQWFAKRVDRLISRFRAIEHKKTEESPILAEAEQHNVVENIEHAANQSTTPLRRWEHVLEHPVSLLVLPIFALANAGVVLEFGLLPELRNESLALGIVLGLVIGKGLGIPLLVWVALRLNLGHLPDGLSLRHVVGLGLLGGMGFTMSIFISSLGFSGVPDSLMMAKTAILLASLVAGTLGYLWLRYRA